MWKGNNRDRTAAAATSDSGRAALRPAARIALAVVCVALVAVVALWRLWSVSAVRQGSGRGGVRRPNAQVGTAAPAPAPKAADAAKDAAKPAPAAPHAQEAARTPEEVEERARDPLYDRHHIVAAKPLLGSPLEQIIHSVFSVEPGDMPPMLPPLPVVDEERFGAALTSIVADKEDYGEEAKEAKAIVDHAKEELKRFRDDGGTIEGFLQHYVNELDAAFKERNMCRELQMKSLKKDPPEIAREFYDTIQKRLKDRGIKPLALTGRQKAYLGIEE